jgi:hypothetical protein
MGRSQRVAVDSVRPVGTWPASLSSREILPIELRFLKQDYEWPVQGRAFGGSRPRPVSWGTELIAAKRPLAP